MSNERILVVDDEPDIRDLVRDILEDEGYSVTVAGDADSARKARNETHPDLALLDIWMPGTDGISLLKEWQDAAAPRLPVIMMSGHGTIETAVEATRLGAFDFVEKPLSLSKLLLTVRGALARGSNRPSAAAPVGSQRQPELVGTSPEMAQLRQRLRQLAGTATPALIRGEYGSGKRTAARMVHALGPRSDEALVEFDLGTVGSTDAADHLFGTDGAWQRAARGSLVIHDIAEMDPRTQGLLLAKLAAAGSDSPRLLALTAENLDTRVDQGLLRKELLHSLSALAEVPSLRDHAEDVPDLVIHFVDRLTSDEGLPYRHLPVAAQNRLRHHHWPGNIAELRSVIRRLLITAAGDTEVTAAEVDSVLASTRAPIPPATAMPLPLDLPLREARETFERAYLEHQLRAVGGRIGELAQRVGMERTHLYRKLKSLGIDHRGARSRG